MDQINIQDLKQLLEKVFIIYELNEFDVYVFQLNRHIRNLLQVICSIDCSPYVSNQMTN